MSTTHRDKSGGKPRQRSRKTDQQGRKPERQQVPKPEQRDEDQIDPMAASTDAPANGAAAPADEPLIGEVEPANAPPIVEVEPADARSVGAAVPEDVPSIGEVEPANVPPIVEVEPADARSVGAAVPEDNPPINIQTIANAYRDYTRKSFQENRFLVEKLMAVRSLDKAVEVQTEFAKQAYANFVAESQKICELYSKLARQSFRPWEGFRGQGERGRR